MSVKHGNEIAIRAACPICEESIPIKRGIAVMNSPDSDGSVFVGLEGDVTFLLRPGQSTQFYDIDDVADVWCRSVSSSQLLHWIGE